MTTRIAVPHDPERVSRFVEMYHAEHGFPPIAGGENEGGAPALTTPPPAEPAAPAAAPAEPAAPAEAAPPWVDTILSRMDAMGPPPAVDPVAAELGFVDPPPAGQPPQMQPPASPGQPQQAQPGTQFPGQVDPQQQQVDQINQWVQSLVAEQVQQAVSPQLQQLQEQRRNEEIAGLRADIPAFNDPQKASEIVARARQWAGMYLPNNPEAQAALIREPAFLETVYHAGNSIEQARLAQAQQSPGAAPAVPANNGYPIEQPGAAAPAGQVSPEQAAAQSIVNAGQGNGLRGSAFA